MQSTLPDKSVQIAYLRRMKKWFTLLFSVLLSLGIHWSLFNYIFPQFFVTPKKITLAKKTILKATIVKQSARVDIVALPQHTLSELKELQKKERIDSTYDRSKKRQLLLIMLQDIAKRDITKKELKKITTKREPKVLLMAGNVLSKGMALTGKQRSVKHHRFYQYLENLPAHIRQHWKLPTYLLDQGLRCRIKVIISPQGELLKHSVIESSGVKAYDQAALRATQDAAPYPRPHSSIVPYLQQGHILLGFPD